MRIFQRRNGIARGVDDRLLRFSVGIEEVEDLIADLQQVFSDFRKRGYENE